MVKRESDKILQKLFFISQKKLISTTKGINNTSSYKINAIWIIEE